MANKIIKAFYTTIDDAPLTGASPKVWIYEETSGGLSLVVNGDIMIAGPIPGSYIYNFSTYDIKKIYHTYSFADNVNAVSPYYMGEILPTSSVNPGDIWNATIDTNSSVTGSFGAKIAQYGGVSHVIREVDSGVSKGMNDEVKKLLQDIKNTMQESVKKINSTQVNSTIPNDISESINRKIPEMIKINQETLIETIVDGLSDINEQLLDAILVGLSELKNNKN